MQHQRNNQQQAMMLLPPLEEFIPSDHPVRRLNQVLDLSFVHEAVRDRYCQNNGRPSIDPEVIIRLFLLQAVFNIPHVRELMRQVQVNLAYRWFIGYQLDERLPDHSTLSKALDRFGDEVFNELFARSIEACGESGLIEGKMIHIDATSIRADLDRNKVKRADRADKDAALGRFGDGSFQPGYKQQTVVDDHAGVIVGLWVEPANASDEQALMGLVDDVGERLRLKPEVVCVDGAYPSGHNAAACEDRGIRLVGPPQPVPKRKDGKYTIDKFNYDEASDEFECPAGERLRYTGSSGKNNRKRRYQAAKGACSRCRLKERCTSSSRRSLTVSRNHAALMRLRADSETSSFKRLYQRRAPVVEGVFAMAKARHGLRRARWRSLARTLIQCLLVGTVINLKRLISHILAPTTPIHAIKSVCSLLRFMLNWCELIDEQIAITGKSGQKYPMRLA